MLDHCGERLLAGLAKQVVDDLPRLQSLGQVEAGGRADRRPLEQRRRELEPADGRPLQQLGPVEATLVVHLDRRQVVLIDPAVDGTLGDVEDRGDVADVELHVRMSPRTRARGSRLGGEILVNRSTQALGRGSGIRVGVSAGGRTLVALPGPPGPPDHAGQSSRATNANRSSSPNPRRRGESMSPYYNDLHDDPLPSSPREPGHRRDPMPRIRASVAVRRPGPRARNLIGSDRRFAHRPLARPDVSARASHAPSPGLPKWQSRPSTVGNTVNSRGVRSSDLFPLLRWREKKSPELRRVTALSMGSSLARLRSPGRWAIARNRCKTCQYFRREPRETPVGRRARGRNRGSGKGVGELADRLLSRSFRRRSRAFARKDGRPDRSPWRCGMPGAMDDICVDLRFG